jgi:hypothetical protein
MKDERKVTTIMARATAWGKPTVGNCAHHVTQSAAPAPNAFMRRSLGTDRGQKQGASHLLGLQNNSSKCGFMHLRVLITEAYPQKGAPYGRTIQNQTPRRPALRVGKRKKGAAPKWNTTQGWMSHYGRQRFYVIDERGRVIIKSKAHSEPDAIASFLQLHRYTQLGRTRGGLACTIPV